MCGFVGKFSKNRNVDPIIFNKALKIIDHRGPDSSAVWSKNKNIFLGHNRLSIIDTSSNSDQPLLSKNKDAVIVFNGEIYNYLSLKKKLHSESFITNSDTEVILQGYLEEGCSFFEKLRGIYAFAILDLRNGIDFILARDPAGVKPLYYQQQNSNIIFASEIKAIKLLLDQSPSLKENSIKQYLNLGFIPEPNTVYDTINALRPGYFLKFSENKNSKYEPFFKYNFSDINNNSFNYNINKTSDLLDQAVKRNLTADVDVSVSLSGGIDSSLIYYFANKYNPDILAQTISFPGEVGYDESLTSRIFSNHLSGNHKINAINDNVDLDLINKLFLHFDQPYADSSAIPVFFLNKYASRHSKVLIGGDGGDELFNGYPSQHLLSYFLPLSRFNNFWKLLYKSRNIFNEDRSRKISRLFSLIKNENNPFEIMYHRNSWLPLFSSLNGVNAFHKQFETGHIDDYKNIFEDEIPAHYKYKIVFDYFRKIFLSDYLRKTDMMSMLNGVEWRIPFLDEDLTSFALTIPFSQKSSIRKSKIHLRELHRKLYPKATSKMRKQGFQVPLDSYLDKESKSFIKNEILKKDSIISHFLKRDYIKELARQFFSHNRKNEISRGSVYQRILMLYVLQIWSKNQ